MSYPQAFPRKRASHQICIRHTIRGLAVAALLDGAVLPLCGALLMKPGYITDAFGFACLVPALRRSLVVRWLERRVVVMSRRGPGSPAGGVTIDGEFEAEGLRKDF